MRTTTYTLQVAPNDKDAADHVLTTHGIDYTPVEHGISLTTANATKALATLLSAQITVEHYDRDETDLESVFLNVTNREATHENV